MRLVIWTVMMAAMLASFAMAVHYRNLADEYRRHGAAAAVRTQPAPESKPPAAKAVSAAPAFGGCGVSGNAGNGGSHPRAGG